MSEFEEARLGKLREAAGLREVEFPACCLSCDHHEHHTADSNFCVELDMYLDNAFSICNHYTD